MLSQKWLKQWKLAQVSFMPGPPWVQFTLARDIHSASEHSSTKENVDAISSETSSPYLLEESSNQLAITSNLDEFRNSQPIALEGEVGKKVALLHLYELHSFEFSSVVPLPSGAIVSGTVSGPRASICFDYSGNQLKVNMSLHTRGGGYASTYSVLHDPNRILFQYLKYRQKTAHVERERQLAEHARRRKAGLCVVCGGRLGTFEKMIGRIQHKNHD